MPEYESVAEMVSDCADIPQQLRAPDRAVAEARAPQSWTVDERCVAPAHDLDEYV